MITCHITGNYSGPEKWLPVPDDNAKQKATMMKDHFLIKVNSVVESLTNVSIHVCRYPETYTVSADVIVRVSDNIERMRAFWDINQKTVVFAEHYGLGGIIANEVQIVSAGETPEEWAGIFFQLFCQFLVYLKNSAWVQYEKISVITGLLNLQCA